MATRQQSTLSSRKAGPPHIIFSDEDGIFWLRGDNLARAKKVLDILSEQGPFGLDAEIIKLYIDELIDQGVSVGISCGNKVWTIARKEPFKPGKVASRTLWLSPLLLFGQKELACISRRLASNHQSIEDITRKYAGEDAIKELGVLYVYEVADLFEVDYELTGIPKATVEALAVAAHQIGQPLRCELVAPKSKRNGGHRQASKLSIVSKSRFAISSPVQYGQLRFDI